MLLTYSLVIIMLVTDSITVVISEPYFKLIYNLKVHFCWLESDLVMRVVSDKSEIVYSRVFRGIYNGVTTT